MILAPRNSVRWRKGLPWSLPALNQGESERFDLRLWG